MIDFFFGVAGDEGFGVIFFDVEESPFGEFHAAGDAALAHGDVVFFAAGEVGEGVGELEVGDDAEVALDAVLEEHGGFGLAMVEDAADLGEGDEGLHEALGGGGGGDDVDIFDGFFPSAKAAGEGDARGGRMDAEAIDKLFGQRANEAGEVL